MTHAAVHRLSVVMHKHSPIQQLALRSHDFLVEHIDKLVLEDFDIVCVFTNFDKGTDVDRVLGQSDDIVRSVHIDGELIAIPSICLKWSVLVLPDVVDERALRATKVAAKHKE